MATATEQPKKAAADIASVLGVETVPLADLRGAVSDLEIARAWAAGLIEFGRTQYCVTGPVGKIGSSLVVEGGEEWTGPKTRFHKSFADIVKEELPKTEMYKRYEMSTPTVFGEEPVLRPVKISEADAVKALALRVKLTDKGLSGDQS